MPECAKDEDVQMPCGVVLAGAWRDRASVSLSMALLPTRPRDPQDGAGTWGFSPQQTASGTSHVLKPNHGNPCGHRARPTNA